MLDSAVGHAIDFNNSIVIRLNTGYTLLSCLLWKMTGLVFHVFAFNDVLGKMVLRGIVSKSLCILKLMRQSIRPYI